MRERTVTTQLNLDLPRPRRAREERTPYDALRPWSAITHGIGAGLGVVGTMFLLAVSAMKGNWLNMLLFGVYGASMVCL